MKVQLKPILPLYPRLTSGIFIANMFHTIAEVSSIIFNLIFVASKNYFELFWTRKAEQAL